MGSSISMDISAATVAGSSPSPSPSPPPPPPSPTTQFDDALRHEVLLVPEDVEDIHIQAPDAAPDTAADAPANNTRYGKGKHWKKNLKKKNAADGGAVAGAMPTERTIDQRREQIRPIIDKLTELQMNVSYPAIRELYKQLNHFVKTGEDAKIKIPFPEFSRRIKGELSNATYIPCWVKLEVD
jgi:hypothetical protein